MYKYGIFGILGLCLFGTGCNMLAVTDRVSDEKTDTVFAKKQECSKHVTKLKVEVAEFNSENIYEGKTKSLRQVCYSPLFDTCVAIIEVTNWSDGKPAIATYFEDLFTGRAISTFFRSDGDYFANIANEEKRIGCK